MLSRTSNTLFSTLRITLCNRVTFLSTTSLSTLFIASPTFYSTTSPPTTDVDFDNMDIEDLDKQCGFSRAELVDGKPPVGSVDLYHKHLFLCSGMYFSWFRIMISLMTHKLLPETLETYRYI